MLYDDQFRLNLRYPATTSRTASHLGAILSNTWELRVFA